MVLRTAYSTVLVVALISNPRWRAPFHAELHRTDNSKRPMASLHIHCLPTYTVYPHTQSTHIHSLPTYTVYPHTHNRLVTLLLQCANHACSQTWIYTMAKLYMTQWWTCNARLLKTAYMHLHIGHFMELFACITKCTLSGEASLLDA